MFFFEEKNQKTFSRAQRGFATRAQCGFATRAQRGFATTRFARSWTAEQVAPHYASLMRATSS
jgi:hypothetical protein